MELRFTEEEIAFRQEVRAFIRGNLPAKTLERMRLGYPPTKSDVVTWQRILNKKGWATYKWPQEYGGQTWSPTMRMIFQDENMLAHAPEVNSFNITMIGPVLIQFGTPEQKERFIAPTANLDIWWCQGFSEPEAGSDLASLRTTAVRDGDHYIINGQKTWTTLGQYADWIFLLVRTNPDAPKKQAGISFIRVEMNTPGITLRPIKLIDGSYEVNEVFFEDVRVPANQLVGEENAGWSYAKFLLSNERTGIARIGTTKAWLAEVKERATKTPQGHGTLLDDPLFAARVAEVEGELLALELTQMRVSEDEAGGKPNPASSILKLRGSQLQQAVTELLVEVAGSDGLQVEAGAHNAAAKYLNYRKTSIYGGSNEVQRSIISATILGL